MAWEIIKSGKRYSSMATSMAGIGTSYEEFGYLSGSGGIVVKRTTDVDGLQSADTIHISGMCPEEIKQALDEFRIKFPIQSSESQSKALGKKAEDRRKTLEYIVQLEKRERMLNEFEAKQKAREDKYRHI